MDVKTGLIDFHFHSSFSDGSEAPTSIIKEAKRRNIIGGLALTDHNNGNGVPEMKALCQQSGISYLEGVEIYLRFPSKDWSNAPGSCGEAPDGVILGRCLDWDIFRKEYQKPLIKYWEDHWLPATLDGLRSSGLKVSTLNREEIRDQVKDLAVPAVILNTPKNPENWPVLLRLEQRKNPVATLEEIVKNPFSVAVDYLYDIGMPAYVLRVFPEWSVFQATNLAKKMSGVLFAAHPGGRSPWTKEHLNFFVKEGGKGAEVWNYNHTPGQINWLLNYARENELLVSGGSDWHGKNGRRTLGCWDKPEVQTPVWVLDQLLEKLP